MQQIVRLTTREKLPQLVHELKMRKGSVLVFVKSKHGADRLAKQLKQYGCKVGALHGDLRQNRRRQVMEQFRDGMLPVLVATDVAARGIDVADIACVINYDLPQCAEDYIHRIGRTGRAGSVGTALSFVTEDVAKWTEICRVCRLGKVTELTKTSQTLPAPKFVPEPARRKKKESTSIVKKTTEALQPALAKEVKTKTAIPPKPKAVKKQPPQVQTQPENAAQKSGFNVVRVGGKKVSAKPAPEKKRFHMPNKKKGKHKFFKKKRK